VTSARRPSPTPPRELPPGGFWLRAGGYFIDAVLVAFVGGVLSSPLPAALRGPVVLLAQAAYFTLVPVLTRGRTLGKLAAGVTIVRVDGEELDYRTAALRVLGYAACGLTLGLGFLSVPFERRKRGLHDFVAGTRVIQTEPVGPARRAALIALVLCVPLSVAYLGLMNALGRAPRTPSPFAPR
jgi:uncharacterized RDD family membrane protein YckC